MIERLFQILSKQQKIHWGRKRYNLDDSINQPVKFSQVWCIIAYWCVSMTAFSDWKWIYIFLHGSFLALSMETSQQGSNKQNAITFPTKML